MIIDYLEPKEVSNKLFVYMDKDPKMQAEVFNGTKLNTCNTESPRGYKFQNNPPNAWLFEVEPKNLKTEDGKVIGTLRYGLYMRVECSFNNIPEFIDFFTKINEKKYFTSNQLWAIAAASLIATQLGTLLYTFLKGSGIL